MKNTFIKKIYRILRNNFGTNAHAGNILKFKSFSLLKSDAKKIIHTLIVTQNNV